jgi:hypothetical protein
MVGLNNVKNSDIKKSCDRYTNEYYEIIDKNYDFFNKLYKILQKIYSCVEKNDIITTHIVFMSLTIAFVKDLSVVDRTTLTLPRYKIYNLFNTQVENFIVV